MKYLLCCLFAALLLPAAVVVTTTSEPVEAAPAPEEEQPAPGGEGTVLATGPDGAQYEIVEVPAAEDLHNRVRPVRLETEKGDFLWGTLIKTPGLADV